MSRILIVDDEPAIGWSLRELFSEDGHLVEAAATVETGLETCARFGPDAVLLDVRLPGRDGIAALPEFRAVAPGAPVVVMTAFGDLDTAVRAVQAGAFDYLVKPFDLERVSQVVARALEDRGRHVGIPPVARLAGSCGTRLVGSSPAMQEVFKQISLVAPSDLPVLITGATGTGKDVAARAIHAHSARRAGPFVAVSLAALPPSVIESELFGHVRGAFTGATADRAGLFELAGGGTLFLDEIAEPPLDVQVKLLRALESREVVRIGSATPRRVDVRVIAATNRDLADAVARGTFRDDLYHRLRVFPIHMPPLSAREGDIEALADHFLAVHTAEAAPRSMAPDFLAALASRQWPGNLRELGHAVEYAAVVSRGGTLRAEHLPPAGSAEQAAKTDTDARLRAAVADWVDAALGPDPLSAERLHARLLELVEPAVLERVLAAAGGNRTAAARILGLDRATLRSKLGR